MNTKAVIYARVSTNKQADRGTSLDTQIDGCKQYAQERGLKIVGAHNDCLSGITPMCDRPGLMAAYNNAIEHEAKLLIVWDEDRLVRDTLIYAKMRQRFDEVGIKIDFVLGGSTLSENGQQAIIEIFPNLNETLQHLYRDLDISVKVDTSRVNYKTANLTCRLWESPHVSILDKTSG